MKDFKVGLALGGGGLCGVAHIGFLKALEENNIQIDMISGISMGSIIGGLYASGMTIDEMIQSISEISKGDILDFNLFKILKESIFTGKKIEKLLKQFSKVENIEDTKIKFYTQAVDVLTGKLHTFESGSIVEAMRASSSIPGIFAPVYKNDTCYVDGGIVENVPYNILKEKGADVIIAVNCLNDYKIDQIPNSSLSMLINSFNIVQEIVWKMQKEKFNKNFDIFCHDSKEGVDPLSVDLKSVPTLIEHGRICGEKYIKEIKKIIKKKQKSFEKDLI